MTEKRYKRYLSFVLDDYAKGSDRLMTIREVIPRLNELYEENEQLKQAYTQLEHRHSLLHDECIDAECDRDSYHKDIVSLEKENEQLKDALNQRTEQCDKYYKENEQLKQQIQQLQHWNKCLAEKRHQELSYRSYTASKSEKELKELLEPKLFNCSDR